MYQLLPIDDELKLIMEFSSLLSHRSLDAVDDVVVVVVVDNKFVTFSLVTNDVMILCLVKPLHCLIKLAMKSFLSVAVEFPSKH